MSARKDAEAQKDAKLAEELEEARQAQKELDRREKEDADSQDKAKKTVAEKAETRENDDTSAPRGGNGPARTEEHTSELQSPIRTSYTVLCLKKKTKRRKYLIV